MKTALILTSLLLAGFGALPSASASEVFDSTPDVQCMDVYSETYLGGGYWLVRRDSCSAQVYECPEGYDPPAPPCREAQLVSTTAVGLTTEAGPSEPNCLQVYRETEVGPVTNVSRDSCQSEWYVCEDDDGTWESDETVQAFVAGQLAEPDAQAAQDCATGWLGEYIAWGS